MNTIPADAATVILLRPCPEKGVKDIEVLLVRRNRSSSFVPGYHVFPGGNLDPEDYQHRVGDAPTILDLHPNSPGYRLILNNVLFPAAKKKPQKT